MLQKFKLLSDEPRFLNVKKKIYEKVEIIALNIIRTKGTEKINPLTEEINI